jgi:hypothetical protein
MEASWPVYVEETSCFSCHHQALPVMSSALARSRGLKTDWQAALGQMEFTRGVFSSRLEEIRKGNRVGGRAPTAAYVLVSLAAADEPADETTDALVEYLLLRQKEDGSWRFHSDRPPSGSSPFTATALAVRGLRHYASDTRKEKVEEQVALARDWILGATPENTEDKTFRLLGLKWADAAREKIREAATDLLADQREDGGWAQQPGMESDAYATGEVLVALREAAGHSTESNAYARGTTYLLETQLPDGSWHVATRAKPIQEYFESGFPHGKDQFISMSATAWATMALLHTLPPTDP